MNEHASPDQPQAPAPAIVPQPVAKRSGGGGLLRQVVETAVIAAAIYLGVHLFILPYEVEGASMNPNLQNSERLLVSRQSYLHFDLEGIFGFLPGVDGHHELYPFGKPERGDIIVFNPPVNSDKPYVKRIIGLPGERVTFENGAVYVDGQRLDEPYIDGDITFCSDSPNCDLGPVPDGYVFVLGDNRGHSSDSRVFGFVAVDRIIGRAVFTNWPLDDFGPVHHADYGG